MIKRNNTSFPTQITSKLKELYSIYNKDSKWQHLLKYYQYITKNLIVEIEDSRGLLLYFTMGMGKTRTAVSVALAMDNMPVIIILPKGLQNNFENTILYVEKELGIKMKNKINYVSMDAYNSMDQLKNISNGINNSLIIIDEAHNFFKSIISGTIKSNAYRIYESIMNANNIKLLFLTGTPISKDPFEIVPCINMLSGFDSLPIYYDQFNTLYVDEKNKEIINRSFLANRLVGLVSYATISKESENMFPTELPTIIHKIEMGKYQYQKYLQAREKEESNKNEYRLTKANAMSIPKQLTSSAYYVKSRSISNYIESDDGIDTKENAPKLDTIAKNVLDANGLVMVYSQFVNNHGLKQLIIYLKKYGFEEFNDNYDHIEKLRYVLYTGDVNQHQRNKIIKIFNSDENKYGSIIKVILVSKTGAEGLDLKNVRETHQMEPYWDLSRNNQVKSRAIRYGSHTMLLESERTVQPHLYISIANKEMLSHIKKQESRTIDEIFNDRSIDKDIINNKFRDLLKDVSIECSYLNLRQKCYICNPSNQPLFTNDPILDTKISNPCSEYIEEEKYAKKIIMNDKEYYYSLDPLSIYEYNSSLDGYVILENEDVINEIKLLIK